MAAAVPAFDFEAATSGDLLDISTLFRTEVFEEGSSFCNLIPN